MSGGEFDPIGNEDQTGSDSIKKLTGGKIRTIIIIVAATIVISLAINGYRDSLYNSSAAQVQQQEPPAPANPFIYTSRDYNFQMEYPKGWEVIEGAALNDVPQNLQQLDGSSYAVIFQGPKLGNNFVNINVGNDSLQGSTFDEYVVDAKATLTSGLASSNYRLLGEHTLQVQGRDAFEIEYVVDIDGVPSRIMSEIVQNHGNVLILTFVAPSAVYGLYAEVAATTIGSIHFIN